MLDEYPNVLFMESSIHPKGIHVRLGEIGNVFILATSNRVNGEYINNRVDILSSKFPKNIEYTILNSKTLKIIEITSFDEYNKKHNKAST